MLIVGNNGQAGKDIIADTKFRKIKVDNRIDIAIKLLLDLT